MRAITDKAVQQCDHHNQILEIFGAPRKIRVDQKWFDAHDVRGTEWDVIRGVFALSSGDDECRP
jgi:hypothetical protein